MRVLLEFTKGRRLRFLSHLDMQRLMQRALRRSGLPVKYSGGYSPHSVMNFASALAVGCASTAEVLDVTMAEDCPLAQIAERLGNALPADMRLTRIARVADKHPAPMGILNWADYDIEIAPADDPAFNQNAGKDIAAMLVQAAAEVIAAPELIALRRTKSGEKEEDIRPMIACITADKSGDTTMLHARLAMNEPGTLKVELVMQVLYSRAGLTYDPNELRITRASLLTGRNPATAISIMEYKVEELLKVI